MSLGTNDTGGTGGSSATAAQAAIGTALLGLSSSQVEVYQQDFFDGQSASIRGSPPGWLEALGGGATIDDNVATPTGTPGGSVSRMQITATANSNAQQQSCNRFVGTSNSHKWYFAWRQAFATAPTANTQYGAGLTDATQTGSIRAGVFGPNSTAFFSAMFDGVRAGTYITSPVAIDTAQHIHEMWLGADGRYHYRVDGGVDVQGAAIVAPKTGMQIWRDHFDNGAGSSAGVSLADWCVYVVQKP